MDYTVPDVVLGWNIPHRLTIFQ